jgi:hypothetical protein
MSNNKQSSVDKVWLILPLIAFAKCSDGKHELVIGWLTKRYTFKFNNNEQQ